MVGTGGWQSVPPKPHEMTANRKRVKRLWEQGLSAVQIAEKLRLPLGKYATSVYSPVETVYEAVSELRRMGEIK